MPPDPPRGKGPCGPFKSHSRLIALQCPLIPNVIETPAFITSSMTVPMRGPFGTCLIFGGLTSAEKI